MTPRLSEIKKEVLLNAESNSPWQDVVCSPRGNRESTDRVGSFLAVTANTKPAPIRRVLHHGVHVLGHAHHSPPQHWRLNYGISLLVWVTSHTGIDWAEVINTEENFNRWTFAVNTGWLVTDLLVLQCWFLKRLITSIWPFILPREKLH